jgi:catechol 2,3-dioxygenase-like lactoylglutathione lyase family enzyme
VEEKTLGVSGGTATTRREHDMFRGLTSFQVFVDDVSAAERWYSEVLGVEPYFRSEDAGLPPGHVGYQVGNDQSELGLTDRRLAPDGLGTGPGGTVTYWQVDDVPAAHDRLVSLVLSAVSEGGFEPPPAVTRTRPST